jgi:hypothetical protein
VEYWAEVDKFVQREADSVILFKAVAKSGSGSNSGWAEGLRTVASEKQI